MVKALSFRITSEHLLLCVFLSLLGGVTDSTTTSPTQTETSTSAPKAETTATVSTTQLTTILTTKPPPKNVSHVTVLSQNENSITLMWDKVENIPTYILKYENNGLKENVINEPAENPSVTHVVSSLSPGIKYDFTLITTRDGLNSTGYQFSAPTAPLKPDDFKQVDQNETSVTLQWNKVGNIPDYRLEFNGREINVNEPGEQRQVTHTIHDLTHGTEYSVTLYTVFENINSSGASLTAVTAPLKPNDFKQVDQNETSVTLQWNKVGDILDYRLEFNGREINVNEPGEQGQVTHTILNLTHGTEYSVTLYTVFKNVSSSGASLTAVTAPLKPDDFKQVDQNETSVTLQWNKVGDILDYRLEFNGREINVNEPGEQRQVTHTILNLTHGTEYSVTLYTVFKNVSSSGASLTAVTAPLNADEFKQVNQNETSVTLQWNKVGDILDYRLEFNGEKLDVSASVGQEQVTRTIQGLINGTEYSFTLFTVFKNVNSGGKSLTAVTAPRNALTFEQINQTKTSITLQWDKVADILDYTLEIDGREINVNASLGQKQVTITIEDLTDGTKYSVILFTVFKNIRSSGKPLTVVTLPPMVDLVNDTERSVTSITLQWHVVVGKDWSYSVQMNGEHITIQQNKTTNVVSQSFPSLKPGTLYLFKVTTMFAGFNSTTYEDFTVTAINCETWNVTSSSIHGTIEGLFSNATATYNTQTHVSPRGNNVTFSDLVPGATYNVTLMYEKNHKSFVQCRQQVPIFPANVKGNCEYWASGYSVYVTWDKPRGVFTQVEVNVSGKSTLVNDHEQHIEISGFLPARKYEVSLVSLSSTLRSEPYFFSCQTDPRGVIAGSVFAVLLFALLVCVAVFIFLKKPDIISKKKPFIGGSKLPNKKHKAISVAKFPDHFNQLSADQNRGFTQEYESLASVGTEQTRKEACLLENKPRNRFNNVLPYDWCRVKLSASDSSGTSDYINASYMPGYNSSREYIATQGPLPSTVNDFWRMVWEQKVKGIVMVTNCTEGGRTKCEQYWPADSQHCLYGELLVTNRSEQQEPNWTLREFTVKNRSTSEERTVKHFHFTAWPDHGVPEGTEVLIQFRELVRHHIQSEGTGAPTVVHCSAGVGRTGTIIALDVLLQQLQKERAVGINGFVHKMRLSRPHMVQTESQYVFLHQCIMDCLRPNGTTEENIYENSDMIYANATALREFHTNA